MTIPKRIARFSIPLILSFSVAAQAADATTAAKKPLSDAHAEAIRKEGIENSRVHDILRRLTHDVGQRLTGSDQFTKACEWGKAEFERLGLEVELEEWDEWPTVWNRGKWVGRIVEPIELDMYVATEAWTAGTDGMQTAGFVAAPRAAPDDAVGDSKGKWVLSRRKPSQQVRDALAKAGALGVVYRAGDPNEQYPTRVRVFGNSRVARAPLADAPTMPEIAVRADHFDQLFELFESGKDPVAQFEIGNTFREGRSSCTTSLRRCRVPRSPTNA